MSSEFGVEDIVVASNLALEVGRRCSALPSQYNDIAAEAMHLARKLIVLGYTFKQCGLSPIDKDRLQEWGITCISALQDVTKLLDECKSIPLRDRNIFQQRRWDYEKSRDIKSHLRHIETSLSSFNKLYRAAIQARFEKDSSSHLPGLLEPDNTDTEGGKIGPKDDDDELLHEYPRPAEHFDHSNSGINEDTASVISRATVPLSMTSTAVEEIQTASAELLMLLSQEDKLAAAYHQASNNKNIDQGKFEGTLRRLIKQFAINLHLEASTDLEKLTVPLVSSQARQIAAKIGQDYFEPEKPQHLPIEELPAGELIYEKRYLLDKWLYRRSGTDARRHRSTVIIQNDDNDAVSDIDTDPEPEHPLQSLQEVKNFLTTSEAFDKFSAAVQDFAKLGNVYSVEKKSGRPSLQMPKTIEIPVETNQDYHNLDALLSRWRDVVRRWEDEIGWEIPWELSSFTASLICLTTTSSISWSDMLKLRLELFTGEQWDWWPLSPPRHKLLQGSVRVEWTEPARRNTWTDISPQLAGMILSLYADLREGDLNIDHPQLCLQDRPGSSFASSLFPTQDKEHYAKPNTAPTEAAKVESREPHEGNSVRDNDMKASSSTAGATANQQDSAMSLHTSGNSAPQKGIDASSNSSNTKAANTPIQISNVQGPQHKSASDPKGLTDVNDFHILFCVQRGRNVHSGVISSPRCTDGKIICDDAFFEALRRQYYELRGFWRYWFFPRQFDHCHGWRFQKYPPRLFPDRQEFPLSLPYEIEPPPVSPYRPTMAEDLWYHRFYDRLTWYQKFFKRVRNAFIPRKDCPHRHSMKLLKKMPRRITAFDLDDDLGEEYVYGLKAELRPSLVYIAIWEIVLLAAGLAFYSWWLKKHPNDLQNAIVPWTIIIGAFLFFWTPLSAPLNAGKSQ